MKREKLIAKLLSELPVTYELVTRENIGEFREFVIFHVSPAGKVTSNKWRKNGQLKTWKTRPNDFKLPIKYGLYAYDYITDLDLESKMIFGITKL